MAKIDVRGIYLLWIKRANVTTYLKKCEKMGHVTLLNHLLRPFLVVSENI